MQPRFSESHDELLCAVEDEAITHTDRMLLVAPRVPDLPEHQQWNCGCRILLQKRLPGVRCCIEIGSANAIKLVVLHLPVFELARHEILDLREHYVHRTMLPLPWQLLTGGVKAAQLLC